MTDRKGAVALAGCGVVGSSARAPMRLLVVDDEPDITASISEMFAHMGHAPTAVSTATAALDLIREQDFGAIISDLRMPGMDGRLSCNGLR